MISEVIREDEHSNSSNNCDDSSKSNHSDDTELTSNRIKDLLKNEIDVNTIQEFIINNLTVYDANNIRATLRTAVECLMEEETLKLRGSEEAASILRTFFELLEK